MNFELLLRDIDQRTEMLDPPIESAPPPPIEGALESLGQSELATFFKSALAPPVENAHANLIANGLASLVAEMGSLSLGRQLASHVRRDALNIQRWAIVVAKDATHMIDWIQPLRELRARQFGRAPDEVIVYQVAPRTDQQQSRRWVTRYYHSMPEYRRPRYLLILGDFDQVSLEFQQVLSSFGGAFVGRLCFTDEEGQADADGFRSYCAKVVSMEAERDSWSHDPRMLFYASHAPGDYSLALAYTHLLWTTYKHAEADEHLPHHEPARLFGKRGDLQWNTLPGRGELSDAALMRWAPDAHPSVLFSVSHGRGRRGTDQRLLQGAPILGDGQSPDSMVLDPGYFQGLDSFLPRGLWFMQACFSAGTPARSAYEPLLRRLARAGASPIDPDEALRYLADEGTSGFVARVPQIALAQPRGPIAVIGHADLAFDHSYQITGGNGDVLGSTAESSTHYEVLRAVAMGSRVGNAAYNLIEKANRVCNATMLTRAMADAASPAAQARIAWQEMQRQDLAGYILLGDPAVQLPVRQAARVYASEER